MIGSWFLRYMTRSMASFGGTGGALQRVSALLQEMVMSLYLQGGRTAQQTTERAASQCRAAACIEVFAPHVSILTTYLRTGPFTE